MTAGTGHTGSDGSAGRAMPARMGLARIMLGPNRRETLRWKLFGLQQRWHKWTNQRFDLRHGTDTAGEVQLVATGVSADAAWAGNEVYRPLWEGLFRRILRAFAPLSLDRYHFVDLGSGKGKLLLLASGYPFRTVTGVEYSPGLHATAQRNIAIFTAAQTREMQIESCLADATCFEVPDGPCIAFVFNSFRETIMEQVMAQMGRQAATRTEPLFLVYVNVRNVRECPVAVAGTLDLPVIVRRRQYVVMANRAGAALQPRLSL